VVKYLTFDSMVAVVMCEINLHHLYNLLITASLYGLSKKFRFGDVLSLLVCSAKRDHVVFIFVQLAMEQCNQLK